MLELIQRFFDIYDYGKHVWGGYFYERLSVRRTKLRNILENGIEHDAGDVLTEYDLRFLLRMASNEFEWAMIDRDVKYAGRLSGMILKLTQRIENSGARA